MFTTGLKRKASVMRFEVIIKKTRCRGCAEIVLTNSVNMLDYLSLFNFTLEYI
jgi:hypothetical protein